MIVIKSFTWWLSLDRVTWQAGSFWNSKWVTYRKNSDFVELSKWPTSLYSVPNADWVPTCMAFWKDGWAIKDDHVSFTSTWKVYTTAWAWVSLSEGVYNAVTANNKKFLIGSSKLFTFTSVGSIAQTLDASTTPVAFSKTTEIRPALDFYGDLIIGNGNSVARYNEDNTFMQYSSGTTNPVIGWLDWTIYALTQVGANIYVWCNNWINTNLYIWDGVSELTSQKIPYPDMPVQNVALVWNMHHWWSKKWDYGIRQLMIWESYQPQEYGKSDYPDYTLTSSADNDNNRLAITNRGNGWVWDIETMWGIVFLPWIGSIYTFWKYLPWQPYSICREFSLTGTYVTAMTSGSMSAWWRDAWGFLAYSIQNGTNFDVKIINLGQKWEPTVPVLYGSSGNIESMEYQTTVLWKEDAVIKILVPVELKNSACSIKVYLKVDGWSYVEVKNITSTDYGTGIKVVEITWPLVTKKFRKLQLKFELITSNTAYSPKLYNWTTIITKSTWNLQ